MISSQGYSIRVCSIPVPSYRLWRILKGSWNSRVRKYTSGFCIHLGNTNEQVTLKPLEQKLNDNFGISKLVVCTGCGLFSYDNRKNNDVGERAFITVQSLKKLKKHLQRWSLENTGWHIAGSDKEYDLSEANPEEHPDTLFYKDRWIHEGGLSQRLIVTFSFKYREYPLCKEQTDRIC